MYKLYIQCNNLDALNLISNEKVLSNISYIIYNMFTIDTSYLQTLFEIKAKNRHIKTILQVQITENYENSDISTIIKNLCNYGFDGILFTIQNTESIPNCKKIIQILKKLPEPYDFSWEIYYMNLNNHFSNYDDEFLKMMDGIINLDFNVIDSTNIPYNKIIKVYDQRINNNIQLNRNNINKVFILDINRQIIDLLMNFNFQNNNLILNNLHYPTSSFIKNLN